MNSVTNGYASTWDSPERKALRESVAALTKKEIVPNLPQWEEDGELPRELHKIVAKAGFLGLGFPEEVGGSGGDLIDVTASVEAMLEAGGSGGVQASLFTHGIALPHIVENGSADLIDRFVRPTLAGEKIGSLGITEPGTGSDVANIRTRAVRDGDEYVINGSKMFITSGVRADFVTTVVRTGEDGHGGLSLIVVEKGTPGFTVSKSLKKMGWWCSDTAELSYDNVRVPAENLLGGEGQAFAIAQTRLSGGRIHHAMRTVAMVKRSLAMMCERALSRRTQGEMLAQKQMVQQYVADSFIQLEQFRLLVLYTAWLIDKGRKKDARTYIAAVKVAMADVLHDVVRRSLHVHGALGCSNEMPLIGLWLAVPVMGIADGPTEVHKLTVAKAVLSQHKPSPGLWPTEFLPDRVAAARARFAAYLEREAGNQ
jgi:acyl-CoA dehydrogenase